MVSIFGKGEKFPEQREYDLLPRVRHEESLAWQRRAGYSVCDLNHFSLVGYPTKHQKAILWTEFALPRRARGGQNFPLQEIEHLPFGEEFH